MAKNRIAAEFEIKAILEKAQSELNGFKSTLDKIWAGSEKPKGLSKAVEELAGRLNSLQKISEKGVVDTDQLKIAASDYKKFKKDVHDLTTELSLLTKDQKRSMLGEEELKQLNERNSALEKYAKLLERNIELKQKENAIKTKRDEKIVERDSAKSRVDTAQKNLDNAKAPKLSEKAEEYLINQKKLVDINKQIAETEKTINKERAKGTSEANDNNLTRAIKNLERLQAEKENIDVTTGKSEFEEYEKSAQQYEEQIAKLKAEIEEQNRVFEEASKAVKGFDKELEKLAPADESQEFEKLKKALKSLGVEGVDSAKDLKELKQAVSDLEDKAIAGLDAELQEAIGQLKALGGAAESVGDSLDKATDSIKEQNAELE